MSAGAQWGPDRLRGGMDSEGAELGPHVAPACASSVPVAVLVRTIANVWGWGIVPNPRFLRWAKMVVEFSTPFETET